MSREAPPTQLDATIQQIADLYGSNLDQHGIDSKSVGWKDAAGQTLRFAQLLSVVTRADWDDGFTINDLGTGYGALYDHLTRAGANVRRFIGYDISPDMLTAARDRLPPTARLIQSDHLTEHADYSIASGIFNVRFAADDATWRAYMERTIRDLATHSRKGFAFNALSTYVDWKEPHLFYADPLHWFDHCKRHVSRFVTLLHDTPLYEWTLVVRKEPAP